MSRPVGMGRQLTVQGWQNLLLFGMGAVVLAGVVSGAILMNRTEDVSREVIDRIQPARIAAYQLQAALRDQETAVRGYAITANPDFLEPYYDGIEAEQSYAADIRAHVGHRPLLVGDLEAIDTAAENWRISYAEPIIASVAKGTPSFLDSATTGRGKVMFDELRALFAAQNDDLEQARSDEVEQMAYIRGWRDRVLAVMVGAFFVTAILLAVLLHSAVNRPLANLAEACRRITEGNFGERIIPRGPRDIRAMAADVEDMRQRIVDELEATRSARARLDEQAEELRRSNAELEQFAYVASHDLQEPLRKVASFCQLLEKRYGDQLDERGTEYIGFAVDGAKRMQVLINDLLTFSRVGRLNATHTEVDLDESLDAALSNLSNAIDEADAEISRPDTPLPRVMGDPTLMTMVWQNLIGNAVKFRRDGVAPRIAIGYEKDGDDWAFSVADNGIGIGEEFVDKVFVIFQRLHGRDEYSGTGIGLALCKKIVEYHGGTIWIDSSWTAGACLRFTLPIAVPTAGPAETTSAVDADRDLQLEGTE